MKKGPWVRDEVLILSQRDLNDCVSSLGLHLLFAEWDGWTPHPTLCVFSTISYNSLGTRTHLTEEVSEAWQG